MKKYRLSSFQLSQSYLFYWDKIEKANYFLESILDTAGEGVDGRLVQALLAMPVGDGGQWDMVANLVQKYGLVPQTLYPDSYNALNSSLMDRLITTKLREDALRLRDMATNSSVDAKTINAEKEKMLREIHLILTLMLGPPPSPDKAFTWEFYDEDGNFHSIKTRPTSFAKELSDKRTVRAFAGTDVHTLFSLVNDPRNAYNRLLSVKRLGNVWEGRPVTYVNVDMPTMKKACIEMLQRGIPVFFGSDVGKYSDSLKGIMDTELFEYELGFNIKLGMKKAERLMTGESQMTHAMVLTGVHVLDGKSVRWRVENSWSDRVGDKGYFVMSDAWMDEFVYQAVVDPSVVSAAVRKVLEQKPKMLELWDPMGALA
jgi:bleomycin hydrolase